MLITIVSALFQTIVSSIPIYIGTGDYFKSFYTHCWVGYLPVKPRSGLYWCTETDDSYIFCNLLQWRCGYEVPKYMRILSYPGNNKPLSFTRPHPNTEVYHKRGRSRITVKYSHISQL